MRRKTRRLFEDEEAKQAQLAEHNKVQAELARHEKQITDLAARLVRLEAEVDIFRPFFVDEKGLK